ncbi:unnamed protein product [Heterobilharzia americana]|nr:unnamed protein product [Heterobilharzia americana]
METADVSVIHRERTPSSNRKLQASIRQPVSDTSTQTDQMKATPPVLTKNTFDVVTQSGTIFKSEGCQAVCEELVLSRKDLYVLKERKDAELIDGAVQACVQVSKGNMSVQCSTLDVRSLKVFDVETQSGIIYRPAECQTISLPSVNVKEGSMEHTTTSAQTINKKLQATISHPVTEKGVQTLDLTLTAAMPMVHTAERYSKLHETAMQTDRKSLHDKESVASIRAVTTDVQTQSGVVHTTQASQTHLEYRPRINMKECSTQYEPAIKNALNKDVQVDVYPPVSHRNVQTQEIQTVPTVMQKYLFDVQTQSGIIKRPQEAQTVSEMPTALETMDVSVIHEDKRQFINKKLQAIVKMPSEDMTVQTEVIEKTPSLTLPRSIFDVQTQSGIVKTNSETQTPQETKPTVDMKDVSVLHAPHAVQSTNKKIQVVISCPSDSKCLQTDDFTIQAAKSVVQTARPAPQVVDEQLQTEFIKSIINTFDVQTQSGTVYSSQAVQTIPEQRPLKATPPVLTKNTFDVVTQSGTIHCAQAVQTIPEQRPLMETADVSVIHRERTPSSNRKLQASIRQPVSDTSTQTDQMKATPPVLTKNTFDVVTQSGTIHCAQAVQTIPEQRPLMETADVSVIHRERTPSSNRKLQASIRQPVSDTSTQTDQMKATPPVLTKNTFDVVTQSGTIHCAQAVQTIPEQRPLMETADVSVIHRERTPSSNRKLQASIRQPVSDTSTQTDQMKATPPVLTKNTFDVVTQSGTIHCAQAVQTIPEQRPLMETADVSVIHRERTPSSNRKLQASIRQPVSDTSTQTDQMKATPPVLTKNTFDVVTQSGTIHCAQAVQTIPEQRPLMETADVSVIHGKRIPSSNRNVEVSVVPRVLVKSTQTRPTNVFEVAIQSTGDMITSWMQTVSEFQRVGNMRDATVGVTSKYTEPLDVYMRSQSMMRPRIASVAFGMQTEESFPVVLRKEVFDVQTESGKVFSVVGVQTDLLKEDMYKRQDESPVFDVQTQSGILSKVAHVQTEAVSTMLPLDEQTQSFDVQVQSGIMTDCSSVQTLGYISSAYVSNASYFISDDLRVAITEDRSVSHMPTIPALKNKKLQVSSSLVHATVQAGELKATKLSTITSTTHMIPVSSQSTQTAQSKLTDTSCQVTLPSSAYDVQTQFGYYIQWREHRQWTSVHRLRRRK